MANAKIHEMITERIVVKIMDAIKDIEEGRLGIAPWNRPWFNSGAPTNLISKKAYKGINIFLLSALGYSNPYFVTYNQAKKLGGNVKKKEKGCPVIFWKVTAFDKDKEGKPLVNKKGEKTQRKCFMLRYYTLFNVEQCEGFEKKIPTIETREFNPIVDAQKIIDEMPNRPTLSHNEARAYYVPSQDAVNLPKTDLFKTDEEYYSTAFHELVHSTGHTSRLKRKEVMDGNSFGSHDYSIEELVAEMGAVFLCNECGIESTEQNSLAYLKSWLGKLRNDVTILVSASGRAQKAVDYILDTKAKEAAAEKAETTTD